MNVLQIIFDMFASTAVLSGVMVVAARNPVHSVLFLVLAFFSTAGIWLLLNAEFLALVLVLVYVGAVMTLFLFVVMMLRVNLIGDREGYVRYLPWGVLTVLLVTGFSVIIVGPAHFGLASMPSPASASADYSNIADLGSVLYTQYAYPFEVSGVLLLAAIVAAISLTHRKASGRKTQDVSAQMAVRRSDRVRLVKMKAEKKK